MSSLVENFQRLASGQLGDAACLSAHMDAPAAAERFLAHHGAATASMRAAREHLLDALRAIEGGDRHVLSQFLAVSRLLGIHEDLARPVSDFGLVALRRGRWNVALDAFAQALRADETVGNGSLAADLDRCAEIAEAYALASQTLGRRISRPRPMPGPARVGVLVSHLADGEPDTRLLEGWANHADSESPHVRVYVTESWTTPPAHAPLLATPLLPSTKGGGFSNDRLRSAGFDVWHAPGEADIVQRSRMLTERIARDAIDVLLVDTSLADAAAWMTLAARPSPKQFALLRRGRATGLAGLDGVIDLDEPLWREDRSLWGDRGVPCRAIFQGVDAEPKAEIDRSAYKIASDAVVMMTISHNPARTITAPFARTVARALAECPRAVYLIVGPGRCDTAKQVFDAAGVGKRVGYAGDRRDLAAFATMSDIYVAEFPHSDRDGVLTAMSLGRPVAILAGEQDRGGHARFVGAPHAIVGGEQTFLDRLVALIKEPSRRTEAGAAMATRATSRYAMANTISKLNEFIGEAVAQRSDSSAESHASLPIRPDIEARVA